MLCSSTRIILRKNQILGPISAFLLLTNQFSNNSKQTHLRFSHRSSVSLFSKPIRTEFSRPLLFDFRSVRAMASQSQTESVHNFIVKDAKGNDADLSTYKGKVLLIVNVASKCGMTNSNYTELNQLYEKYKEQGLEILAFPCNQFGEEEPGSNDQIVEFVCTRFKSEFPIFDKIEVNGENTAPVYKFLKSGKWGIIGDDIQWNFAKFLVDKDGQAVDRYYPTTSPLTIEHDIKKLLGVSE
ncbi:probable glutathione peroxidase 8 isoform X1 [Quercus robur]|uniref:probable glutathione peroxidase 8 isoform X1 n=1 Tax=Quercus robur TaxID=38942 RepID=UPI0021625108|nr:probable glutathione peroxidase 8 isoform X1 [Quercus robur]